MSKRLLDLLVSFGGLVLASPVLLPVMFLVWWQDRHSPFYVASRVGLDQRP
ncbi:MAG: sugar transferase, partial [Gammaproteobacteria bacterium]|nr:sugar transferase [Gammaproteobacteria bacterium]